MVIVSPLPAGVSSVRNQGILNSGNAPSVLSDDPQTTEPGDPTITSVFAQPRMIAAKRAVLIETGVQDGVAGAGDTLLYEVELRNDGDTAATNAVFSDTPDAATPLVAGSVVAGPGVSIVRGNTAGDASVEARIEAIPAGSSVSLSFRVAIPADLPAGTTRIQNQGSLAGANFANVPTDDPDTPEVSDPTITTVRFPRLAATKRVALEEDVDRDGTVTPGDRLLYTIEIENRGPAGAAGVVFDDTPDANTRLIAGSVATNVGSLALGNGSGDTALRVNVGNLPPDATVRISFSVLILNDAPAAFDRVTNQGAVASGNAGGLPTDDPTTAQSGDGTVTPVIYTPTAITLLSFSATRGPDGIIVRWTTGVELDTAGFQLLRSSGGRREAVRVTRQLIPARGKNGGASYEWRDPDAEPGTDYYYWLQEVEYGGAVNEFGPVRSSEPGEQQRSFLPFIQ